MSNRTPQPSQTDEELREQIILVLGNALYAGKSIQQISKITKKQLEPFENAADAFMALIQADRERLYAALLSESEDPVNSFGKVVPVDIIKKMFNREGADNE